MKFSCLVDDDKKFIGTMKAKNIYRGLRIGAYIFLSTEYFNFRRLLKMKCYIIYSSFSHLSIKISNKTY